MKLGFKRVKYLLTGFAGLAGIGALIELTKVKQRLNQTHLKENHRPLCQGKPDFDHIDEWKFDHSLRKYELAPT